MVRVCARNVPPNVQPSPTLVWTHPPGSVISASKTLTNRKPIQHTHMHTLMLCWCVSRSASSKDAGKKDDDDTSDLPLEYLQSSLAHESQVHTHTHTHTQPSINGCDLLSFSVLLLSLSPPYTCQAPPASNPNLQLQEEDDLQLAIAMSLNEQENKVT